MKRTKHFLTLIICVTIMLALFAPTVAAYDNGGIEPPSDAEQGVSNGELTLEELEAWIAGLEAQLSELWAFISAQPEVDYAAINRQIREAAEIERFIFRLEYYNVCFIIANTDLLRHQRTLTERQLELERVRLALGFSSQRNVDALSAHLNSLRRQIELNDEIVQIKRRPVSSIGNFEIPASASPVARTVDELRSALIRNNAALFVLERQISQMSRQGASNAEIRLMRAQRDLLVRQLEMAATNGWTAYLTAKAQYDLAQAARPALLARLNFLDELFRIGEIGAVARLEQRYAIYEELHGADIAAIALAIAVVELEFIMIGVAGR